MGRYYRASWHLQFVSDVLAVKISVLCVISSFDLNGRSCRTIQESRAVAEKPRDAVVKFDTYRNFQRHSDSTASCQNFLQAHTASVIRNKVIIEFPPHLKRFPIIMRYLVIFL